MLGSGDDSDFLPRSRIFPRQGVVPYFEVFERVISIQDERNFFSRILIQGDIRVRLCRSGSGIEDGRIGFSLLPDSED